MSLSVTCKPIKPCESNLSSGRHTRAPQASPAAVSAGLHSAQEKVTKPSAVEFKGPTRVALALPWVLVAVMTAAAGAFYALPEGRLGGLFSGPTLAIGQEPQAGSRVVPQPRLTKPLQQSERRRQTVLTPVWETRMREEAYTIRKPVVETSFREEKYTVTEPVTTYAPQVVDQGRWIDRTVAQPGPEHTRLKWVKGGWTTNEIGQTYWQLPGLRLAKEQGPSTYTTMRVWQPNVVTTQVPQVSYKPTTKTRQVPVETVRYVEEQRTRKVPERFCRLVEKEVGGSTQVSSDGATRWNGDANRDEEPEMIEKLPNRITPGESIFTEA